MLTRRQLLTLIGCTAVAWRPGGDTAAAQRQKTEPELATVTLEISGMT